MQQIFSIFTLGNADNDNFIYFKLNQEDIHVSVITVTCVLVKWQTGPLKSTMIERVVFIKCKLPLSPIFILNSSLFDSSC